MFRCQCKFLSIKKFILLNISYGMRNINISMINVLTSMLTPRLILITTSTSLDYRNYSEYRDR